MRVSVMTIVWAWRNENCEIRVKMSDALRTEIIIGVGVVVTCGSSCT